MNDRVLRKRSRLLRLGFFLAMCTLILRLVYIQVAEANDLSEDALKYTKVDKQTLGTRGTIYDRTGENKLVFTGVAYDINIDLAVFRDKDAVKNGSTPEEYARILAPLLGATENELLEYMNVYKNPDYKKVFGIGLGPQSKKVNSEVHDKIQAAKTQASKKYRGITTIRTDIRKYPNNDFAAHVLGYYGLNPDPNKEKGAPEEIGLAGIEYEYNNVLMGKPGHKEFYTDKEGNPLPNYHEEVKVPPVDGKDVVLTIDSTIQHFVEDELDNIVSTYAPKHASIIVADPNNGEILALSNRPTFNPNNYAKADTEALWNNWALKGFEPGSTFKVFVLSAALAEKRLNLNETFESGSIAVGGETFRDWETAGWGLISYRQAVYHSSNVGFVKIGQKLGKDLLYDYIYRFGFDKSTGIDLPGEGTSQLFKPKTMREADLASTSFGQGISVTPMQQVAAMMAVANGGTVYQPHVVKELRDQQTDKTIKEFKPQAKYKVADEETFKTVRTILEETINVDKKNYIKGYHVAGKTGTAEVPKETGGGYADNKYRLSFIGFAPANKPRIICYVTVDQPSKNAPLQFGSLVAAPSAKVVMENTLRYLQVPVDPNDGVTVGASSKPAAAPVEPKTFVKVPDFIGATKQEVTALVDGNMLKVQPIGDGPRVTSQWPDTAYGQVPEGTTVHLYYGPEGSKDGKVKVPDLRGMSMRESIEMLNLLQLDIVPSGSGFVMKQGTPPGTMVPSGTSIKLEFAPQS